MVISRFAPAPNLAILNHLRGGIAKWLRRRSAKSLHEAWFTSVNSAKPTLDRFPRFSLLVRRGQEGTHWDSHVVTIRSQPLELRRGACATRFYFRLS